MDEYARFAILDMKQEHVQEVFAISRTSFEQSRDKRFFAGSIATINGKCLIAQQVSTGRILGFCVSSVSGRDVGVTVMAVHPDHRKKGVGSALIGRLLGMIPNQMSWVVVRDGNLIGQKFFSSIGFSAVTICEDHFPDGDGYLMVKSDNKEDMRWYGGDRRARFC